MSSDKPETEAKPKKGKGMLVKLIAGIALIGAGLVAVDGRLPRRLAALRA